MRYYECFFIASEKIWTIDQARDETPIGVWDCRPVVIDRPVRYFIFAEGMRVDFNDCSAAEIITSRRLAFLLKELAPDDIQLVPVEVKGDAGEWWLVHVLTHLDCMDRKHTLFSYEPSRDRKIHGQITGVLKLVVDPERIGDRQIFRAKGWEVDLLVSERVKGAMEKAGVTGAQFRSVSEL